MAIKIETYAPKHLSLEAKIFEEHNIMSLVGDILNIEIGHKDHYHKTPFIKTEFTEDQHRLQSIFRYVWNIPKPYGGRTTESGWYDVSDSYASQKPRPPYRNSRPLESYYRTPTGHREIHRMVQHHQEYLDVLPEQYEKIPHSDTYRNLVSRITMASYWYDFILQKNTEFSKKMQGLTRDTYWSHIDADPFMEELSIFLGYVKVEPTIDHPERPEPRQMAAAIDKLAGHSAIASSADSTYREPQLKITREELEEENAHNFKEWLKNTTPGYFVTHSNHSGKLTETGGLELEVIHVTFQSRQNNTTEDNLAMSTIQRRTNSAQISLFDEDDYHQSDDDDDEYSATSDENNQYTQDELDNHANQCNPNNDAYHSSRA